MKKDNKGFSLVELIIVIAIMAVLVGVLAPQFIKYVEQSRRSRDIQTAQEIREAILADIADGVITADISGNYDGSAVKASTISEVPVTVGNAVAVGSSFMVVADVSDGTCEVWVGGYELTVDTGTTGAQSYKVKP